MPFTHRASDLCLLLSDGLLLSPLIHPLLLRPPILLLLLSSGHCVRKRGCTAGGEAMATVAMEHPRHHRHGDGGCGAPLRVLISHALNEVSQVSRSSQSGEGEGGGTTQTTHFINCPSLFGVVLCCSPSEPFSCTERRSKEGREDSSPLPAPSFPSLPPLNAGMLPLH